MVTVPYRFIHSVKVGDLHSHKSGVSPVSMTMIAAAAQIGIESECGRSGWRGGVVRWFVLCSSAGRRHKQVANEQPLCEQRTS